MTVSAVLLHLVKNSRDVLCHALHYSHRRISPSFQSKKRIACRRPKGCGLQCKATRLNAMHHCKELHAKVKRQCTRQNVIISPTKAICKEEMTMGKAVTAILLNGLIKSVQHSAPVQYHPMSRLPMLMLTNCNVKL